MPLPDHDEAGEDYVQRVVKILTALDLPIPKALADVVDDDTALPDQDLLSFGCGRRLARLAARRSAQ